MANYAPVPHIEIKFKTDYKALIKDLDYFSNGVQRAIPQMMGQMTAKIKRIISLTFTQAIAAQGVFFDEYKEQILEAVEAMPIVVSSNSYSFFVFIDFELLGSGADLVEAYHYHALLQGGGRAAPFAHESQLKNDVSKRTAFWRAVYSGTPYTPEPTDKNPNPKTISTNDLLDETIDARVTYWGNRNIAPEWLFLQFGLPVGVPQIRAVPLVETIRERVYELLFTSFGKELAQYNRRASKSIAYGGKTYQRGQFIPRALSLGGDL